MRIYRYLHHVPFTDALPIFPGISFKEIFNMKHHSDISLDRVEDAWNQYNCLVFILNYNETNNIYYVIISKHMSELSTSDYKEFILNNRYCYERHTYDYYVKITIPIFLKRFKQRLYTRNYLNTIRCSIPFPPTELAYHQQFVEKVRIDTFMNGYELPLLRKYVYESQDIVKEEKEYHPDGLKTLELKQDFEELALLTMSLYPTKPQ